MTSRQARKIVKRQAIRYRRRIGGPENITAGGHDYGEAAYQKALRIVLRKMDRELRERRPGAIARLAELNRQRNALRLRALTGEGKGK